MYSPKLVLSLNHAIQSFPHVFPVTEDMQTHREGISRLVMLDRYSVKDVMQSTLQQGDLVILTVLDHPKFPTKGIGFIQEINREDNTAVVRLDEEYAVYGEKEVVRLLNTLDKPLEIYYEQIAKRVAHSLASEESTKQEEASAVFYEELKSERVVPAGRVLYGAGAGTGVTLFNCYVLPFPHDSRGGLSKHREEAMEIMSRGGGVGTNGSTLRPRHALARGVSGRSSGSVSWLHDLSELTHLVIQGGSRRGAQMILLFAHHPDILEFIMAKVQNPDILRKIQQEIQDPWIQRLAEEKLTFTPNTPMEEEAYTLLLKHTTSRESQEKSRRLLADGGTYSVENPEFLSGANISVAITKEFMAAVENDELFDLQFPDVENYTVEQMADYNEKWHTVGDVRKWKEMGYPIRTYHSLPARDMWKLINICATYSAEPGIFFYDNAADETNAAAYGQTVVATNPCGEQVLSGYSTCNLIALNLTQMANFGDKTFNKKALRHAVRTAIQMADNVIDHTPYFLEANKVQSLGERRIGLGVMGLSDLLIKLRATYGEEEGLNIVDDLFSTIAHTAYEKSIELAKDKESFAFLIGETEEETQALRQKFIHTGYMKRMPESIREGVLKHGIRNSHLLTVAPTGSTGAMIGGSTGLEPYFSFSYYRSGRLGENIRVDAPIVQEYYDAYPDEVGQPLPAYFVSAMSLSPEQHVATQCRIQRFVDSSISKTVNAPKGYQVEDVQAIYEALHAGNAKGGTVYVDGSRNAQVLNLVEEKVYGSDLGDTCPICKEGTIIISAGCSTCSNCGSQLRCDV